MKKLDKSVLNKLNISEDNILQKSELKKIIGGYGTGGYGTDIGGDGSDGYGAGGYGAGGYGSEPKFACSHEYHDSDGSLLARTTECYMGLELAISFCQMWTAGGLRCNCHQC